MTDKRRPLGRLRRGRRRSPPGTAPGEFTVDPDAPIPVVEVIAFGPERLEEAEVDGPEKLQRLLDGFPVTWINVEGLGDAATLEWIAGVFGLHPLTVEDVVHLNQRPKVEAYGEQLFIVARMVRIATELETEQLGTFLGPGFVLTFQERPGDAFDPVRQRIRKGRPRIRGGGPDYLAYSLLDAVIDAYFPVLEQLGERLELLEAEVLSRPDQQTITRIYETKRELLGLRRAIWPHREMVNVLLREHPERITEETRIYLRDTYDHAIQIMDLVDNYRELSSGLVDLYLSAVSHRMNEVMKVLTVIATIFMPLTFIAGIYGMNFDPDASPWNMPELSWYWGYPTSLGLMAIITGALLYFFYRKGWLEPLELGDDGVAGEPSDRGGAPPGS